MLGNHDVLLLYIIVLWCDAHAVLKFLFQVKCLADVVAGLASNQGDPATTSNTALDSPPHEKQRDWGSVVALLPLCGPAIQLGFV
jgi:Flp pilus assembly protein protease CpaA